MLVAPAPARADSEYDFAIPAGPLDEALLALAQQAGVSIAIDDPELRSKRTRGLKGRYTVGEALRSLLARSGFGYISNGSDTIRIVRSDRERARTRRLVRPAAPAPASGPAPEPRRQDIIVTAAKQMSTLSSYPTSVTIVELASDDAARFGSLGTDLLLEQVPDLASTNLGSGRNKLFIRGVADSSFNGVSQATISQYLGDSRLIYSAPDPDLALYDIGRIEVLEGPQGTLYGAGSLGGIVRLVPNPPELDRFGMQFSAATQSVRYGGTEGEAAAVMNVPVAPGKAALRLLGYRNVLPGFIDDSLRAVQDVNRKVVTGMRATLRIEPASGWSIDLGVVGQINRSRDAQYAERGERFLTRRSALSQHYDNDYRMAHVRLVKTWDTVELVSATNYTDHSIDSNFDATLIPGVTEARNYNEDLTVKLLSHETRLSGRLGAEGHWVAGISLLDNINLSERAIGVPGEEETIALIRNEVNDAALFGEATFALRGRLSMTLGGRFSLVRQSIQPVGSKDLPQFELGRVHRRFLPTAALSWKPRPGWLAYVRFQHGFRPGGLQIVGTPQNPEVLTFVDDTIGTIELGFRFGASSGSRLSGGISYSVSRWNNIQADLVDGGGFPFTANIGSGRVRNLSASVTWRPFAWLRVDAAGFLNGSGLDRPAPAFAEARDQDMPNVADFGWRFAARAEGRVGRGRISAQASFRHVGASILAVRAPLNLPQGDYDEVSSGVRVELGHIGLSLDVQNLLDARGNRFSYGNPFSVAQGRQIAPQRPRSIRFGIDVEF